uniref:Glycosyltransferase n=1 Tax=Roseihalotalea indica TaxID=2867963 RepID=A0AA49GSN5_9BACT|nr:glycosyltransferase [Tunicatimonas sp. TK19036]
MKEIVIHSISYLAEHLIFIYTLVLGGFSIFLAIVGLIETRGYLKRSRFEDHQALLSSPFAPRISLIVPMYNEGQTIIDSVRSLLSLQYNNYEVIVVNDGSTDESLRKLIQYFQLVPTYLESNYQLPTKTVGCIYKSRHKVFNKLVVIDKANGGKADALNAGLNHAQSDLVATMDADSIISPDALLKMVKPFLQQDKRVIATGSIVRIANSCTIEDGSLVDVQLPTSLLARFQALEYIRVFLLSRLGWSRLNGLLLISGAFGLFDREIAMKAGGYYTKTVGEDMELTVRMRRYMHDHKLEYKVVYIPDPLCWTEAPTSLSQLSRQRNRWARGTAETLIKHRGLLFNPKYGRMGLLSYPYWFCFEYLAPFVETIGLVYFTALVIMNQVQWPYFAFLLTMVYLFSVLLSLVALMAEEFSYHKYRNKSDIAKLILTALLEPIIYHPIVLINALKGNFDLFVGKKSWGEMKRKGFTSHDRRVQKEVSG